MMSAEKSMAGSLKYMAPEIIKGQKFSADPAIDIWSLGCTFAELLTGKILFQGENYIKQIKLIIDKLGNDFSFIFI